MNTFLLVVQVLTDLKYRIYTMGGGGVSFKSGTSARLMIMIDITVAMIEFFRLVVENEDLYGRDYRLIDENHDRDYPKAYMPTLPDTTPISRSPRDKIEL